MMVHVDDFVSAGPTSQLHWLEERMSKRFECKHKILGPTSSQYKELVILNRQVRWTQSGIEYRADKKHIDTIVEELGIKDAKIAATPAVKEEDDNGKMTEEEERAWKSQDPRKFRSLVARCNYLAGDRPDIQFATRVCASGMSDPQPIHWRKLKRLARYLLGTQNSVCRFPWQRSPRSIVVQAGRVKRYQETEESGEGQITAQTDADWAANRISRKSVNGGVLLHGGHLLRSWSKEQGFIALSSGESELYAANYGAQQAMGLQSIMTDFGVKASIRLEMDASAAIGIVQRQGLGRTRHISANDLWLQEKVKNDKVKVVKIPGSLNSADIGTKILARDVICAHMRRMGFHGIDNKGGSMG